MEKFFKLSERGNKRPHRVHRGLTTFFAMVYIPHGKCQYVFESFGRRVKSPRGFLRRNLYCHRSFGDFGTVLIGLFANLPLLRQAAWDLTHFFVYTVCLGFGFTYANALVLVLADGLVFILLTVTDWRKRIFLAIPESVRTAISVGIGLFIAFLGLQNSGIIVPSTSTGGPLLPLIFCLAAGET